MEMRKPSVIVGKGGHLTGRALALSLLLCLSVLAAGCTTFTDTVPLGAETAEYPLYGERTIGQTFVCHHAGLTGISVLAEAGTGDLVLHLRTDVESTTDLATVTISPGASEAVAYHRFSLPVQDDVNGRTLYVRLEAPGATATDPFLIPYSADESGAYTLALGDNGAVPGRLSLRLDYGVLYIAKDLVRQAFSFGLEALWLLFLTAVFYLLPGGAAVVWLLREGDWIERVIVALGLSVAIYALLMYATMTGLRLGRGATLGFLAACAVLIGVRWWLDRRRGRRWRAPGPRAVWERIKRDPSPVVLAIVFALVLGVRIWITRDMVAPRWGDSYQHTVIAQLMIDHGGLFESWEPYAPYTGLTTHIGFHANVVAFHWLSGVGAVRSVIWVGQMLNALACLALYPLGKRIGGRWGGVLAVLISGLLSPTPMMYVNWGRYPQLTGQVVLPIGGWLLLSLLERDRFGWRIVVLNVIAAVGQFFGYYRMPYYFALFAGSVVLCVYIPRFGTQWRRWGVVLLHGSAVVVLVAAALVPWGLRISGGPLATKVSLGVSRGRNMEMVRSQLAEWGLLPRYVYLYLLVIAAIGFIWAVIRADALAVAAGVWAIGMVGVIAAKLIGVPGTAFLDSFASMVFMYAPTSLLVAWFGARLAGSRAGRSLVVAVVLLLVSLLGAYYTVSVSDPAHDLVERADMAAMAWIRENTPSSARFLVNGFLIYEGRSAVGSDAGWWIPLLTERANTMPPQYALLTETELEPGYGQRVVDTVARLRETPVSTPQGLRILCNEQVTHVYVGQGQGRVASPPSEPLFTPEELASSPFFARVYHRDRVWIFELVDGACNR